MGKTQTMRNGANGFRCPVCAGGGIETFFEIPEFPTLSNVLLRTAKGATGWPRAPIRLGFCRDCAWIGNTAFDARLLQYGEHYENSLHYSSVFQSYADRLARYLFRRYDLKQKDLIEIGCGQGDFLHSLCRIGRNRGVGFDPGYAPERAQANGHENIRFVRDYYSPAYEGYRCDFLCCRHVLEHIEDPRAFLGGIRRALDRNRQAKLYFEVPNGLYTLREMGIWDPIYEHRSYFSRRALRRLFVTSGFRVLRMRETFGRQFLGVDADMHSNGARSAGSAGNPNERTRLAWEVRHFARAYRRKTEKHRIFLDKARRSGQKVVLWGAGAKAVNFLNVFRDEKAVEFVVDQNPFKQGKFIPGTGQRIVAPGFLVDYRADAVIVMNPLYRKEVAAKLEALGLHSKVLTA